VITYPAICIDPGAALVIGGFPVELTGSDSVDALVRQYGSLPNGSLMRFSHSLLSSSDAALVFNAWHDSLSGTRALTLPDVIAGGIAASSQAAATRWLTPAGQAWYFSRSPVQGTSATYLLNVSVEIETRALPCGGFV